MITSAIILLAGIGIGIVLSSTYYKSEIKNLKRINDRFETFVDHPAVQEHEKLKIKQGSVIKLD